MEHRYSNSSPFNVKGIIRVPLQILKQVGSHMCFKYAALKLDTQPCIRVFVVPDEDTDQTYCSIDEYIASELCQKSEKELSDESFEITMFRPTECAEIHSIILAPTCDDVTHMLSKTWLQSAISKQLAGTWIMKDCRVGINIVGETISMEVIQLNDGTCYSGVAASDATVRVAFPNVSLTQRNGIEKQWKQLVDILEMKFDPKNDSSPSIRGILVTGPPGCGKKEIVKATSQSCGRKVFVLSMDSVLAQSSHEQKRMIDCTYGQAVRHSPCTIVLDGVDNITTESGNEDTNVIHCILNRIANCTHGVISVLVARTRDKIPSVLLCSDSISRHVLIPALSTQRRECILKQFLSQFACGEELNTISHDVAVITAGMSLNDMNRFCRNIHYDEQADLKSVLIHALSITKSISTDWLESAILNTNSFTCNVVGYDALRDSINTTITTALSKKSSISGLLLYGPSGCGKSLLVREALSKSSAAVINIKGPILFSKYFGETELRIRRIFQKAREMTPTIIWIDDIETVARRRDLGSTADTDGLEIRVLSQFLSEMDGIEEQENVFVIGCTNKPDLLDEALLRPGRLERHMFVGPPCENDRLALLNFYTRNMTLSADVSLSDLSKDTGKLSCADLAGLCRESALSCLSRNYQAAEIPSSDFYSTLASFPWLKLTESVLKRYVDFGGEYSV